MLGANNKRCLQSIGFVNIVVIEYVFACNQVLILLLF